MKYIRLKILLLASTCLVVQFSAVSQDATPVKPGHYPNNINVSFIRTWDARFPTTDPVVLLSADVREAGQTTQYVDGLGRPLQTIQRKGSLNNTGAAKDLVSPVVYDQYGRETRKYLPFAATDGAGGFKLDAFDQQKSFYDDHLNGQGEQYYYGKTDYELSGRPNTTYAPGNNWVHEGRGVEMKYWANTAVDEVRKWNVEDVENGFGSYSTEETYPADQLFKAVTIDEHGKQVIEFKDKQEQIILKKVQYTAAADNGSGSDHPGWLCTYYIYDKLNQLRAVIQPEGVRLLDESNWSAVTLNSILGKQCFRYEYDYKGRMTKKKMPDAGEVYMVYDTRDRLVFVQDANMRTDGHWLANLYDAQNRLVITGLMTYNVSVNTLQDEVTDAVATISVGGIAVNNYPIPGSASIDVLTYTFYDDYAWRSQHGDPLSDAFNTDFDSHLLPASGAWPYPQALIQSKRTKGLVTGTKTKILESNQYLYTVNIYDDKNRVIQMQSTNITGGADITTTQYSWNGSPLVTVYRQEKAGANPETITLCTALTYDDLWRVVKVEKKVQHPAVNNNMMSDYITLVENEYDALGQLKTKNVGRQKDDYGNYTESSLQKMEYDYNIRGWLLGMNRDYLESDVDNKKFGFELAYDKKTSLIDDYASDIYTKAQYNGNIGGTIWRSAGDGEQRKYDFDYDPANRFMKADFTQNNGGWNTSAGVDFSVKMGDGSTLGSMYDANGNIKRMQQWGLTLNGSQKIDDLHYTYYVNSNQLKNVVDFENEPQTKLADFRTSANSPNASQKTSYVSTPGSVDINSMMDYTYDANGNLKKDLNKDIGNAANDDQDIKYNHLNLPEVITVRAASNAVKGTITYTYNAAGNRLRKKIEDKSITGKTITTITTYLDGMVYESKTIENPDPTDPENYTDKLQFIGHEEGRVRYIEAESANSAKFEYDYFIKDHLGNVRMVLTEERDQKIYPAATLENVTYNNGTAISKEDDYYNIDASKVVDQAVATGIPGYQNNNGVYNNNYYSNTTANSARLYRLNASGNTPADKTGLGIVIKVMAGDAVNIFGKSYHKMPVAGYTSSVNAVVLSELINGFAGSTLISAKGVTGSDITGQAGFPTSLGQLIGNQPVQNSNRPKAAINWIVLDDQFKWQGGGFDMVGAATNPDGTFKTHDNYSIPTIDISKNGYIYVYCSNESQYDVFFDNLQVIHSKGAILEETHYYPFGLTMTGISSEAFHFGSPENKIRFQGQEFANKEFSDGSGLDMYEFKWRMHDPQVGRFWQVDPLSDKYVYNSTYAFSENKVTAHIELEGLEAVLIVDKGNYSKGDVGHTFVSVGSGKNQVVYTYGRWAGTNENSSGSHTPLNNGAGVMVKLMGDDARAEINKYVSKYDAQVFEIKNANEDIVKGALESEFNKSNETPKQGKYEGDNRAHVIDSYDLTCNNCTTKSLGAIKEGLGGKDIEYSFTFSDAFGIRHSSKQSTFGTVAPKTLGNQLNYAIQDLNSGVVDVTELYKILNIDEEK